MGRTFFRLSAVLLAFICLDVRPSLATPPKVVTTIPPLQSIAANVMQGIATPKALLPGSASPHSYALKPSDAKTLSEADLIVWVGPALEGFLEKSMKTLGNKAATLELLTEKDLLLLDSRDGDGDSDDHKHRDHEHGTHEHGEIDPHIWLNTINGKEIANLVARRLGEMDPENGKKYLDNAREFSQRLDKIRRRLEVQLRSYATIPFMTYHDGFQYFEQAFSLHSKGYVTLNPERPIGAKRVTLLRASMASDKVQCLFMEPQYEPKLVETLTEGTKVRTAIADPLGADIPMGIDFYPKLIENLGNAFVSCLSGKS